jgi:hypothetical protein
MANNSGKFSANSRSGSIQVETKQESSGNNGANNQDGSNVQKRGRQWAKKRPAIGGSNQVAGCDRWVTN